MRTLLARATLSAIVLLVGCTPTAPAPGPTSPAAPPTQSYYCTPDGETSGAPCSKEEYDAQLERDRLYEEAESVYRKLNAADKEIYRRGGTADESVLQYVTGEATQVMVDSHVGNPRLASGDYRVVWVRRSPSIAREGDAVAMTACIDNSEALIALPGQEPEPGGIALENVYFVRVDDSLKISLFEAKQVESC